MSPTNHLNWKPQPHGAYYGHIAMPADSSCVGLVLVCLATGRYPAMGVPAPDSAYEGSIILDNHGKPAPGVTVEYEPLPQTTPPKQYTCETDYEGKHIIWLPPGQYRYRYVVKHAGVVLGPQSGDHIVVVKPGESMEWESPTGHQSPDGSPVLERKSRECAAVIEDLVLDWNNEDGKGFNWAEAVDTMAMVIRSCSVRQVTLARPAKQDLVTQLSMKGIPCFDTMWRDVEYGVAYKNFKAFAKLGIPTGFLRLTPREAGGIGQVIYNQSMRAALDATGKRLAFPPGFRGYLAEARFAAVHFAIQNAALHNPGAGGFMPTVGEVMVGKYGQQGPMSREGVAGMFGAQGLRRF